MVRDHYRGGLMSSIVHVNSLNRIRFSHPAGILPITFGVLPAIASQLAAEAVVQIIINND
jgi:hypothetical protein